MIYYLCTIKENSVPQSSVLEDVYHIISLPYNYIYKPEIQNGECRLLCNVFDYIEIRHIIDERNG